MFRGSLIYLNGNVSVDFKSRAELILDRLPVVLSTSEQLQAATALGILALVDCLDCLMLVDVEEVDEE